MMNYDLPRIVEGNIRPSITYAMPYGEMPPGMLMEKFEETEMGNEEDLVDNYSRRVLTDWRPDTNRFEHEEPRGGTNRSAGMLQLRHNGHRGEAEDPYRPEYFDGFMGNEDREPRGIATDPDMKEYVKQQQARLRFIRFTPDSDGMEQVTGGGRSEGMVMADHQKEFKAVRSRLKIFDRQLDGRREGMRRVWKHRSEVPKQILVQSYGDHIRDYALNPQRRANIISTQVIRDSRAWYAETADADFAFARYSQLCRRAQTQNKMPMVAAAKDSADSAFSDSGNTRNYKAAGLLMANIVRGKKHVMDSAEGDIEMAESKLLAARKTAPFARDLNAILAGMRTDADFAASTATRVGKNPTPQQADHLARQAVYNHSVPAHHYLDAERIYKSLRGPRDNEAARTNVTRDGAPADVRDVDGVTFRSAKRRILTGAKLNTDNDADSGVSLHTYNYRRALAPNGDRRVRLFSEDQRPGESDPSQRRRAPRQNYRAATADDVVVTANFGENHSKERRGRGVGNKYMTRFIDRDTRAGDIAEMGATSQ